MAGEAQTKASDAIKEAEEEMKAAREDLKTAKEATDEADGKTKVWWGGGRGGEILIDPLKETNETLSTLEVDMKKVKVQYLQILDDAKRYDERREGEWRGEGGGMVDEWNELQCIRHGG